MTAPTTPDTVRCSDCDATLDRYAAYEVREPEKIPEKITDGTVETRTFWICPKCWDRIIGAAVLAAVRGM